MKKNKNNNKLFIILYAILALNLVIYAIIFYNNIYISNDLLSSIVGIIIAIIGVSLPLIIANISTRLSEYNSPYIANIFKKEPSYIAIKWGCTLSLIIVIILFAIYNNQNNNGKDKAIGFIIIFIGIASIILFLYFVHRFTDYSVNTDNVIIEMVKKKRNKISFETNDFSEHNNIIEIISKVILRKISHQSSIDIDDLCKLMADMVIEIYNNVEIKSGEGIHILNDVSNKYYDANFRLWKFSYRDLPVISLKIILNYENVLEHAINSNNDVQSFEALMLLYQNIANEISENDTDKIPLCRNSPWMWYFDIVGNDEFNIEYIKRANIYLFTIMKIIIVNDIKKVFNAFIEFCVDGFNNISGYDFPYSADLEEEKKLDKIRDNVIYVYSQEKIISISNSIIKLDDNKVNINSLKNYVNQQYKNNNLRLISAFIGAYCLFKEQTEYIKFILYYNQPNDSGTLFGNKDIVPDDVQTIIQWYMDPLIYNDFVILWDGHNDVKLWFKKYLGILFCRIIEKGSNQFHRFQCDNYQDYSNQIFYIDELKNVINAFDEKSLNKWGIKNENKQKSIDLLNSFIDELNSRKEKQACNIHLDDEKKEKFKTSIKEKIQKRSIWNAVLKDYRKCEDDECAKQSVHVRLNELLPKQFLAKNDNGIYVGFDDGLAKVISDQIDFYIELMLSKLIDKNLNINEANFSSEIFHLPNDYVVVFINYHKMYDFLVGDKTFQWKNEGSLIGITSNGIKLYSYGDPSDRTSRIFIIKTKCVSSISGFDNISIEIKDLNDFSDIREKIIEAEPPFIMSLPEEERESFLCSKSQIKIDGQLEFNYSNSPFVAKMKFSK